MKLKKHWSKNKWLKALTKNLNTLPDKYKFFLKRINLNSEYWIDKDKSK